MGVCFFLLIQPALEPETPCDKIVYRKRRFTSDSCHSLKLPTKFRSWRNLAVPERTTADEVFFVNEFGKKPIARMALSALQLGHESLGAPRNSSVSKPSVNQA